MAQSKEVRHKGLVRGLPITAPGLYVMAPHWDGPCKIGVAEDVAERLRFLQTGCWMELNPAFFGIFYEVREYRDLRSAALCLEQRTHRELRKCDVGLYGEWFDVSVDDAAKAIRKTAEITGYAEAVAAQLVGEIPKSSTMSRGERILYGSKSEVVRSFSLNYPAVEGGIARLREISLAA